MALCLTCRRHRAIYRAGVCRGCVTRAKEGTTAPADDYAADPRTPAELDADIAAVEAAGLPPWWAAATPRLRPGPRVAGVERFRLLRRKHRQ